MASDQVPLFVESPALAVFTTILTGLMMSLAWPLMWGGILVMSVYEGKSTGPSVELILTSGWISALLAVLVTALFARFDPRSAWRQRAVADQPNGADGSIPTFGQQHAGDERSPAYTGHTDVDHSLTENR